MKFKVGDITIFNNEFIDKVVSVNNESYIVEMLYSKNENKWNPLDSEDNQCEEFHTSYEGACILCPDEIKIQLL